MKKLKLLPIIILALMALCACNATFTENEYFTPVGEAVWDDAKNFSEGFAAVKKGDLWGFINENGEIAIEPQFEAVWSFTEGLAAVQINGLWGYIDTTGSVVIEPKYKLTWGFSEGLAAVQSTELFNLYGYINKNGEEVIKPQFNYAKNFKNGAAIVQGGEKVATGHKFSFVKPDGSLIGNFEWFGAEEFSDGLAEVFMTYESAFID
ncbi:MAG: WG repeat-containing protein, partial [Clostridia bacterium]|nr:WG repeat-containing protein [Clostridia bacterium]